MKGTTRALDKAKSKVWQMVAYNHAQTNFRATSIILNFKIIRPVCVCVCVWLDLIDTCMFEFDCVKISSDDGKSPYICCYDMFCRIQTEQLFVREMRRAPSSQKWWAISTRWKDGKRALLQYLMPSNSMFGLLQLCVRRICDTFEYSLVIDLHIVSFVLGIILIFAMRLVYWRTSTSGSRGSSTRYCV